MTEAMVVPENRCTGRGLKGIVYARGQLWVWRPVLGINSGLS